MKTVNKNFDGGNMMKDYESILNGKSDEELLTLVGKMNETTIGQNIYDEAGLDDFTQDCCGFVEKIAKIPVLGKAAVNINLFCGMLKDSIKNGYNISVKTKAIVIGTLVYMVMPVDFIPDCIPYIGLLDDARILTAAGTILASELFAYKNYLAGKNLEAFCESLSAVVSDRFYEDKDELAHDDVKKEVA